MPISGPTDLGTGTGNAAVAAVITTAAAVTAGSCIVVTTINATTTAPASVVDSVGNTYVLAATGGNGTSHTERLYVALNVTALPSGGTITVTPGRSDVSTAAGATAWTGVVTSAAVDDTASTDGGATATSSVSVGPVTDSTGGQLLIAVVGATSGVRVLTPDSPWVKLHEVPSGSADFVRGMRTTYRISAGAADYTLTGSLEATSTWGGALIGLKASAQQVTTTTIRPTATTAAGGWTTGAASLHAALSDQSDATIITGTGV